MARVIDEATRSAKKNEILDCAQQMIYTKGYEKMSIQDIISDLGISKGAFFHYFPSKAALLESLLTRTNQQGMQVVTPIAKDPSIPPDKKLEMIIQAGMQWKAGQKPFMMAILKAWYSDENALVRQKMMAESSFTFGDLLMQVFKDGIQKGVFHTNHPEMAGKIIFSLMIQMSDSLGHILLRVNSDPPGDRKTAIHEIEQVVYSYTDAVERILGTEPGSVRMIDMEAMKDWLPA